MAEMRQAVALLLRQHEPFLATALDRRWDIVMCNGPYSRFLEMLGDEKLRLTPYRVLPAPRLNLLKLLFGPFRPIVANWDEAAREVLERAQREAASDRDAMRRQIVEECVRAAPPSWRAPRSEAPPRLVVTVDLRVGELRLSFFSAITTLGTAQDITLQELHIESFHPADAHTEQVARALAAQP